MRKAAIIGTGGIARQHTHCIQQEIERAELVAAVDIDADKVKTFCEDHNIPNAYTDVAEMLEKHQPDWVTICTPPGTHKALAIQAMEAGAWVHCEKPMVASLAELDAITEAEDRTGNYTASVFQNRFGVAARHIRKLIEDNALGKPMVAMCNTVWYRDENYYAAPWRGKWETEIGGTTMTHGIHTIDLMLYLLGDWQEVRAKWGTLDRNIEADDVAMAIVTMANGAMMSVVNSALSPRQETYVRLDFQKGTIEGTYLYGYMNDSWKFDAGMVDQYASEVKKWSAIETEDEPAWDLQLRSFLDHMDRNERPELSGDDVRSTLEFLTALYKSSATGEPVTRGSITPDDPFYHALSGKNNHGF